MHCDGIYTPTVNLATTFRKGFRFIVRRCDFWERRAHCGRRLCVKFSGGGLVGPPKGTDSATAVAGGVLSFSRFEVPGLADMRRGLHLAGAFAAPRLQVPGAPGRSVRGRSPAESGRCRPA